MGVSMGMSGMDPSMGGSAGVIDTVKNWLAGLPLWASSLIMTAVVLIAAALVGMILGNMYSSIKYPNPEKQGALNPIVRIVFIVLIVGCSVWLYFTFNPPPKTEDPLGDGESSMVSGEVDGSTGMPGGSASGNAVAGGSGGAAMAVAVPMVG